ncbi:myb/SANT-like DNA-binding domain-containing protein 3 [Spodoptera frugiperda]|uniref:Regulatory protein zeste n=1 Tax=Spodoptera frugiperda TaxID=7108 RepID=A0A9R0DKD6_SPOFR|nr:myb/SANT-like DNA-binding domain-containing protein 3 [Spodoptera frugiperda]
MEPVQVNRRKRVANFTADEKILLAQLVKKRPIVESKITDGKSVAKKQVAWEQITQEFNSNANVHKRETITLKRAWDNMKAVTRKARAAERGNLIRTGGGPQPPPLSPQHGAIISIVEEAAPAVITEIKNTFDIDGTILNSIDTQELNIISESVNNPDTIDIEFKINSPEDTNQLEDEELFKNNSDKENSNQSIKTTDQVRRPTDYIRREAVLRIRHFENKKKIEIQILKTQLEIEQIRKKTALLEQEKAKYNLEKAKSEVTSNSN